MLVWLILYQVYAEVRKCFIDCQFDVQNAVVIIRFTDRCIDLNVDKYY